MRVRIAGCAAPNEIGLSAPLARVQNGQSLRIAVALNAALRRGHARFIEGTRGGGLAGADVSRGGRRSRKRPRRIVDGAGRRNEFRLSVHRGAFRGRYRILELDRSAFLLGNAGQPRAVAGIVVNESVVVGLFGVGRIGVGGAGVRINNAVVLGGRERLLPNRRPCR